ncbi:MAG: ABC transporter permease [Spirochaetes bacterium]|nr:ABC transporter permease [Spirochaetota bacterium]
MLVKIKPIFVKEIRQIMRDKLSLGILIFIPVFMLIMFGYALNFDVKHLSIGFYDEDNGKTSRDFINSFIHSEYFDNKYNAESSAELDKLMQEGKIVIGVIIPSVFSKDIIKGKTTSIQVLIDGSNSNTGSTALGYVNAVISNFSKDLLVKEVRKKVNMDMTEIIDYRPRIWYNPELKSVRFLILGLISLILLMSSVISTSLSIVKEKENNTIEQIIVSPIKPYELVIGKIVNYILIAIISTIFIFIAGYFLFGVEIKGNYFLLSLGILIYIGTCLGIGLLISSISETQQSAFMLSSIISLLPAFILSGFVFPIRNMPVAIQLITYIIPTRYFLVILRNIVLKGSGLISFWKDLLTMFFLALLFFGLNIIRLKKNKI